VVVRRLEQEVRCGLTCACLEDPRLGTQGERHCLSQAGCHLVGMTN